MTDIKQTTKPAGGSAALGPRQQAIGIQELAMKSSHCRHGGNQGKTDKHEAEQARSRGMAESLSGARDRDEAEGQTSGKD